LASEIDESAIKTYKNNYGIDAAHDINDIKDSEIPDHDVLCAGFPCQAFSKAGKQMGFSDPTKGTLFFQIKRILLAKKPEYIVLENVKNLLSHDHHNTWKVIESELKKAGYNIKVIVMSPHQLGIPQLRDRVYILGIRSDVYGGELVFEVPDKKNKSSLNAYEAGIFDPDVDKKFNISEQEKEVLKCWNEFYHGIKLKVIGFPVWSAEFGATYPLDDYPEWKAEFCRKNRKLYEDNKKFIDRWLKKWDNLNRFTPTNRKFEWQAGTSISSIWDGYIQFRPSGIRVKRPDAFPALVALVQIPVIGKYKRRLTPREAARLQSFPETFIPDENDFQAYKQFGNAVNVNCVEYLAKQLFQYGHLRDGDQLPKMIIHSCVTTVTKTER
jgi:DNA (cytosine-5)-methyltransferase 1